MLDDLSAPKRCVRFTANFESLIQTPYFIHRARIDALLLVACEGIDGGWGTRGGEARVLVLLIFHKSTLPSFAHFYPSLTLPPSSSSFLMLGHDDVALQAIAARLQEPR